MQRRIGEVWFLPPDAAAGGDDKPRRHVLLTECDDEAAGVLAYASTKATEAANGAAHLDVDPARSPGCGFTKPTRVYPCRLVPAAAEDFLRMTGRLVSELPHLRTLVRFSMGIGSGVARENRRTGPSWRGKIVRLSPRWREEVRYEFAVVLTEHRYSARRRYQIVVPLEDLAAYEPESTDLVITRGTWFRDVSPAGTGVIMGVSDIHSVFHRDGIEEWTGALIDDPSLAALEAELSRLFSI